MGDGPDLPAFLRARLDEDEATARAAGNRRWLVQDNIVELYPEHEDDGFMSWPTRADARHAATWEPERALRDIDAKRRILDLHDIGTDPCDAHDPITCESEPCDVVRLLALPYDQHPDYQAEWRP